MLKPVIGTANQKGGVGKTTDLRIFVEYAALYLKKKTLAIDMDPQCSFSARYVPMKKNPITEHREPPIHELYNKDDPLHSKWDGRSSIGNIFFGQPVYPYSTRIQNLDIIPADEAKLNEAEEVKRQEIVEKVYNRAHQFITLPEVQESYDLFAIDTPPKKGPLTIAASKAMTYLLIPLEMEQQAIEGLQGILTLWKQESLQRPSTYPLHLLGVVASKFHSRRSDDAKAFKELKSIIGDENVIPHKIYDRKQYPEVDRRNISIFDLPDSDDAKKECLAFCEYLAKRIFK